MGRLPSVFGILSHKQLTPYNRKLHDETVSCIDSRLISDQIGAIGLLLDFDVARLLITTKRRES
jgi:hypothetical protein